MIVICVQARMGSQRLPDKSMRLVGNKPLIEWVLRSIKPLNTLYEIFLCTSTLPANEPLVDYANSYNVRVLRGDEYDVLGRFVSVVNLTQADSIVRICADNPFISTSEVERLISYFSKKDLQYAFNNVPRWGNQYPDGIGAEIVKSSVLRSIASNPSEEDREHVTAKLIRNYKEYNIGILKAPKEIAYPSIKLDIDTLQDWAKMDALMTSVLNRNLNPTDALSTIMEYNRLFGEKRDV